MRSVVIKVQTPYFRLFLLIKRFFFFFFKKNKNKNKN
jgi:hypothetical protein